jgi:hypothetical protein
MRTSLRSIGLLVLLSCLTSTPGLSQTSAEAEIRAVVGGMFDGMRAGDSTAVRSALHPGATLSTVRVVDGEIDMVEADFDGFVEAVGTPHDEVWDERIANFRVLVDEPFAIAWMDYAFYLGERFSHCGVNAIQLARTSDGWRVIAVTDTRRRTDCGVGGETSAGGCGD